LLFRRATTSDMISVIAHSRVVMTSAICLTAGRRAAQQEFGVGTSGNVGAGRVVAELRGVLSA